MRYRSYVAGSTADGADGGAPVAEHGGCRRAGELSLEAEYPHLATRSPAHQGRGSIYTPTMKQPTQC